MSPTARSNGVDVLVPDHVACITPWVEAGVLGPAEVHFAAWLSRAANVHEPAVLLGAAMAVWAAGNGHSCVELERVAELAVRQAGRRAIVDAPASAADADADEVSLVEVAQRVEHLAWPSPSSWRAALAADAAAVRTVEAPDDHEVAAPEPLVLCGHRLYLQRYWADECIVAADLRRRCAVADDAVSAEVVTLLDVVLHPLDPDGSANRQRVAADTALSRRLSLVVGGPGTGKTYSVARVLAALALQAQQQGGHLRIALAAPTGKAAARMGESIAAAVVDHGMRDHVPESVRDDLMNLVPTTIHRLLGPLGPDRQRFRHDATNPLPHDVVLIDETSMVSLPLLARLCEAVRPDARLVLIGDPDQLESVELGAVLGDLVDASGVDRKEPVPSPLIGHAVRLLRAHRFEKDSPIALVADAIRTVKVDEVLERLRATVMPGSPVRFVECDDPRRADVVAVVRDVLQPTLSAMRVAAQQGDAAGALEALRRVRMLCAHRRGPYGVSYWNREAERWMYGEQGAGTTWFPGRPVLITRNDPRLGLANGDTGVVIMGAEGPRVAFRRAADIVTFDPVQLESAETAFAMTVHKSQGSEFPQVVLVLPPAESPLVGRDLLYTAVTRASRELIVVGDEDAVRGCVLTSEPRMTGLAQALS